MRIIRKYGSGFQQLSHPGVLCGAMAHCNCNGQLCNRLAMVAPSGAGSKAGTKRMAYHWCGARFLAELVEAA